MSPPETAHLVINRSDTTDRENSIVIKLFRRANMGGRLKPHASSTLSCAHNEKSAVLALIELPYATKMGPVPTNITKVWRQTYSRVIRTIRRLAAALVASFYAQKHNDYRRCLAQKFRKTILLSRRANIGLTTNEASFARSRLCRTYVSKSYHLPPALSVAC